MSTACADFNLGDLYVFIDDETLYSMISDPGQSESKPCTINLNE